ncbi:MAG: T9SS type A sorting domain-containing protein, partial [Bacteroidales bacterium]|nr:T9SS type A sorting domain-containing protein [Bacteroidales bacterium]
GFETAIEVWYSGNSTPAKIDRTDFNHNNQGVVLHACPVFAVTNSSFDIGGYYSPRLNRGLVGVAAELTPMFDLYENSFTSGAGNATGIHLTNSLPQNGFTYKNIFNRLLVGQRFTGYNRIREGYRNYEGARYFCNINTDNQEYDVLVDTARSITLPMAFLPVDLFYYLYMLFTPLGQGVAYHQDPMRYIDENSDYRSCGNQFSDATWNIADYAFMQKYVGSSSGNEAPVRTTPNVGGDYNAVSNSCPSMNSLDPWVILIPDIAGEMPYDIDPSDNSTLEPVYQHFRNSANTMQYVYNQHMDGGNTEALLDAVQGEWKDDVWETRQKLMEQSPFLSEEVLRKIAEQNLLPQALLLEVCLANPDATKNPDFIYFLQYKIKNPMPASMINLIKNKWDEKTLRTVMEEELAAQSFKRDFYCNRMIGNLMHDSTAHPSTLRTLSLSRGTLNDYFLAIESYLQEGNFDGAFNTIYDYTQLNPKLDKVTATEIADYQNYLKWLEELARSGQNIYQLKEDGSAIAALVEYERNSIGRGRVLAHNILCGLYDICLEDMPEKSQAMASGDPKWGTQESTPQMGTVQVFPNPAKEYTSFIWDLGSFDGTAQLSITDQNGRPLLTRPLSGAQGQWIWETASVPSGSYIYSVTANGLQIESGKIVVAK